jgi:hypothetical protein
MAHVNDFVTNLRRKFEDIMMATAFAEVGEFESAQRMAEREDNTEKVRKATRYIYTPPRLQKNEIDILP